MSEDPAGIGGGIYLYTYAYNNPEKFRDPFGLAGCDQTCQDQIDMLRRLFPDSSLVCVIFQDLSTT